MNPCTRCYVRTATGICCSSHGRKLCHTCYRFTHFVEVCVADCKLCKTEDLARRWTPGGKP